MREAIKKIKISRADYELLGGPMGEIPVLILTMSPGCRTASVRRFDEHFEIIDPDAMPKFEVSPMGTILDTSEGVV